MTEPRSLTDVDDADPDCEFCRGYGWVCERCRKPWPHECDQGAGDPCSCNPLSHEA